MLWGWDARGGGVRAPPITLPLLLLLWVSPMLLLGGAPRGARGAAGGGGGVEGASVAVLPTPFD